MSYEIHPLCELIPPMSDAELSALADDISANGLSEPIVIYEGKILDGRHRYKACVMACVDPRFVEYFGSDPIAYVVSRNVSRRHLTESQRALVAAKIANMRQGERTDIAPIGGRISQDDAAEQLKVSTRSVQRAKKVLESGDDGLIAAVNKGEMSVSHAAEMAEQDEVRREIIGSGPKKRKVSETIFAEFTSLWARANTECKQQIADYAARFRPQ